MKKLQGGGGTFEQNGKVMSLVFYKYLEKICLILQTSLKNKVNTQ